MPNNYPISLQEAQGLPDILSTDKYRLNLGAIPGSGDGSDLSIKCQNCEWPGRQNQSFDVVLGGFTRTFAGRNMFGQNTMQASYVEDIQMGTSSKLRNWLEQIRGTQTGLAIGNIGQYSISPELSVFDMTGNEVESLTFYNFYIIALNDMQLESSNSAAALWSVAFKYDYYISTLVTPR